LQRGIDAAAQLWAEDRRRGKVSGVGEGGSHRQHSAGQLMPSQGLRYRYLCIERGASTPAVAPQCRSAPHPLLECAPHPLPPPPPPTHPPTHTSPYPEAGEAGWFDPEPEPRGPTRDKRLSTVYQLLGVDEWPIAERAEADEEADEPPTGPPTGRSGQGAACKAQWAAGRGRRGAGTPTGSEL
jgi:hypothetical protein